MILLDLFSGIGGFHKGLTDAGFRFDKVYFSEVNKYAIANYKYNYEKAEHIGAVENIFKRGIERPNIITFGSPCQDFSLAGKRAGLVGERSGLIQEAIALVSHFRPDIFIWENVKGTFSSNNSEDFWAILQAFANIGGYQIEWQLLNTKWVLPQNRERIYLVGRIADKCRGEVFPVENNDKLFNETITTKARRTQTKLSTTLKASDAIKADDTFIVQTPRGNNKGGLCDVAPTLTCNSFENNNHILSYTRDNKGVVTARNLKQSANTVHSATGGGGNTDQYVLQEKPFNIRRLTEIECERLQGFQDNWTKYGNFNGEIKEISATQRYKIIGNAVTVKIVKLVGKAIIKKTKLLGYNNP